MRQQLTTLTPTTHLASVQKAASVVLHDTYQFLECEVVGGGIRFKSLCKTVLYGEACFTAVEEITEVR